MFENGAATKPSGEQIDEWVKTFTTYTTAEMKAIVRKQRSKLKPQGGWDKTAEQPRHMRAATPGPTMNDANRAVYLW